MGMGCIAVPFARVSSMGEPLCLSLFLVGCSPGLSCLLMLFVCMQAGGASTSVEPPPTGTMEPTATHSRDSLDEVRACDIEVPSALSD